MEENKLTVIKAITILSIIAQVNAEIMDLLNSCNCGGEYEEIGMSDIAFCAMYEPLASTDISIKVDFMSAIKTLQNIFKIAQEIADYDVCDKAEDLTDRLHALEQKINTKKNN